MSVRLSLSVSLSLFLSFSLPAIAAQFTRGSQYEARTEKSGICNLHACQYSYIHYIETSVTVFDSLRAVSLVSVKPKQTEKK